MLKRLFSPSFMGIYDNALTSKECDLLIKQFEKSEHERGMVSAGPVLKVDTRVKSSFELKDPQFSNKDIISNVIRVRLLECLNKYAKRYLTSSLVNDSMQVDDDYTFQKYNGENDGYKQWHTEHGVAFPFRVLVWMFYLNNAEGTEFLFYPNVRAKAGRCLIWPAGFTHTHKGAPNKGVKYIISGWISTSLMN